MTDPDRTSDLRARAERVRSEMGGVEKVAKMSDEGDRTIRQHIDSFLDDDSFREIGTFSRSLRVEEREKTPGDGKIGGHGTVDSRPVAVFGDDITVYRGSSSIVGTRKEHRLYERAMAMGISIVHFGETGGARIPALWELKESASRVACLSLRNDSTGFLWRRWSLDSRLAAHRSCLHCLTMS